MGFDIGSLFGGGSGGGGLLGGIEQEIGQLLGSNQSQQTSQTGAASQSSQAGFNILDPAGILNMLGKFMGGMNGAAQPADPCQTPATTEMPPQQQAGCAGYAGAPNAPSLQTTQYSMCNEPPSPYGQMMPGMSTNAATGVDNMASSGVRGQIAQNGAGALANIDSQIAQLQNASDPQSMQKLQNLVEQRQEMFTMMSNIDKCFHDMCMTAINNMR